ncbi:MAG: hypothetical protein IJD40_02590 [Lachnospiraceae bacterium]|nr:hypothetical protein [Lachnospiraceae bacterium]
MKKGTKAFTLVVFIVALLALGLYIYVTNEAAGKQDVTPTSEKEILLNYDMVENYPKTVRETVKMHCRYLKYIYNEGFSKDFTEDDLFVMNQRIRQLFDEELLEINSADEQLRNLKKEMDLYQTNKQKIVSYTLAEASQIEYNTDKGNEYAKMRVTIAMRIDGASFSVDEEYILRKDADGKWKILGWQAIKQDKADKEGDAK